MTGGSQKENLMENSRNRAPVVEPLLPPERFLTSELGGLVFITSSHSLRQMGCVERPGGEKSSTGRFHPSPSPSVLLRSLMGCRGHSASLSGCGIQGGIPGTPFPAWRGCSLQLRVPAVWAPPARFGEIPPASHPISLRGPSVPPGGVPTSSSPSPLVSPALRAASSARSRWKTVRSGRSTRRRCPGSAAESQRERAAGCGQARAPRPAAPRRPRLTPDVPLQSGHAAAHGGRAQREQAARPLGRHHPLGHGPPVPRRHLGKRPERAAMLGRSYRAAGRTDARNSPAEPALRPRRTGRRERTGRSAAIAVLARPHARLLPAAMFGRAALGAEAPPCGGSASASGAGSGASGG